MFKRFSRRPDLHAAFADLAGRGVAPEQARALADFFSGGDPRECDHVNPRLVAERLGLDERATLRLLVQALYAGLVDLHWDVRCPFCGSLHHRGSSLSGLHHDESCGICQNIFTSRLDDEVRVSFSLASRLRAGAGASADQAFRQQVDERLGSVSGHALLLLPEFQQLFPNQRLLPDESLDVSRVALLFTDLAGSTAIYARRGDPRAYHLVRLHFDELFAVADRQGGLMVKTIGDAVMAAFQTPVEALRAAMEMQAAVAALNERASLGDDERLILKVGLHAGPCLSVTLNDQPDYFGTNVNIAARVQGLSRGGDIVITEAICADPAARPLAEQRVVASEQARLKGIDGEVLVHRLGVL